MKRLSSPRTRWYVLAVLWVLLLVLGFGGFVQQAEDANIPRTTLDNIYLTMQLATLDYHGGDEALNWRLQIARFVAPLIAASTLLQTASVVFREQFGRIRLHFFHDHTIVCGLGGAGTRLALALHRDGQQVACVERDPSTPGVQALRDQDVVVVVGDASDDDVLRVMRLDRAARIVALSGTDAANVAVAAAARRASEQRTAPTALRCSAHLTDTELCVLLRAGELTGSGNMRLDFFNLHERAARAWLGEHPPFGDGTKPPHLMVLGLGQLGRSLVVAAAQRWSDDGEGPLRVTMVDREAGGRWHALRLQHPALDDVVQASTLDLDLEAPTSSGARLFRAVLEEGTATEVAVAFEDESLALSSALLVHQELRQPGVPIVVRTNADTGLGSLVTPDGEARLPFPGLAVFPFLDRACTPAIVEGGVREQLARAIHEDYLGRAGAGAGLRRPWDELDDEQRESSRRAADGIISGMDEISFDIVPLRHWGGVAGIELDRDALETLARREHLRWMGERIAAGWTHGATRDDARKINPLLVGWDELDESARESNREAVRALPAMLARAGFEPVPR